ncbi:hypothetical protein FA95DRAFT_1567405 [Auriscalpium vulgare]|uniref:Uncharacterized protein n=1 Tax=Auriscalpium vulgare TaxID=40419 RepID=A0ACB8R534_9AGAM|nr:hypothetical protein FA95DRAFT_1567405 [Auriscalpium vulgare]
MDLHSKSNNPDALAYSTMCVGWIYYDAWESAAALNCYLEALSICERHKCPETHARVLRALGDLYRYDYGETNIAIEWYQKALENLTHITTCSPRATEYLTTALAELMTDSNKT